MRLNCRNVCACMWMFASVCRAESVFVCGNQGDTFFVCGCVSLCVLKMNYIQVLCFIWGKSGCSLVSWWYVFFGSGKLASDCPGA